MTMGVTEHHFRTKVVFAAQLLLKLNIREHGRNKGEVVEEFLRKQGGYAGQPWCVAFAAWVLENTCKVLGVPLPIDAGLSCSQLHALARLKGRIIKDAREAKGGDLFLIRGGSTGWQHIGIIVSPAGDDGKLWLIEGNTNDAGSAEGDGVYKKQRLASSGVAVDITPDSLRQAA